MFIKQISVFMENKKGRLESLTKALAGNNIYLVALSIADTADYGIMRAIVNNTQKALDVLKEAGFMASVTEVLAVEVPDEPGGLAGVLELFNKEDISVEYLNSFVRVKSEKALILFKVSDSAKAIDVLTNAGVGLLTQEQVNNL